MINLFAFSGFGRINPGYLTDAYSGRQMGLETALFIRNVLNSFWLVAGLATFIYMIMGGFKYITASGDVKATQEAIKQITGAINGLALVIASYAIARLIGSIFGIDIFMPNFKAP